MSIDRKAGGEPQGKGGKSFSCQRLKILMPADGVAVASLAVLALRSYDAIEHAGAGGRRVQNRSPIDGGAMLAYRERGKRAQTSSAIELETIPDLAVGKAGARAS
ncbi:MAG: hypothetical protein ACRD11_08670 [Terriglobia bacterium]